MQYPFNENKAYSQMDGWQRGILVWLAHMKNKGRDVLTSLRAQTSTEGEYNELKDRVDGIANAYSSWPQSKWYLDESSEKLAVKVD